MASHPVGEQRDSRQPMTAVIAYGSSRGSTETVAEAVAEGMKRAGVDASAIRIDLLDMMPARIETADILGVGSPVYFLREAGYMTEFLANLDSLGGKRAFAFCTTGMDRVGEALVRLRCLLSERGAEVVGTQSFRAAMSYVPYRNKGLGNPDCLPDEAELDAARRFGERMARAAAPDSDQLDSVSVVTRWKARLLANRRFRRSFFSRPVIVEPACTGYGSCLSRCLFEGLEREEGEKLPYFTDACVQCLECIAWCPKTGIVPDSSWRESLSTLGYRLGIH